MRSILKMVDGIFVSKICYGLQLLGKVRTSSQDSECADFKEIQLVQNKLLRTLNGSKIIVFVHSETLLLTIVLIHNSCTTKENKLFIHSFSTKLGSRKTTSMDNFV